MVAGEERSQDDMRREMNSLLSIIGSKALTDVESSVIATLRENLQGFSLEERREIRPRRRDFMKPPRRSFLKFFASLALVHIIMSTELPAAPRDDQWKKVEEAVQQGLISADNDSGAGLFMEWAVNKEGEIMRPNTGKLMLPGSKIRWDIHYSDGGEDISDEVQLGVYFYPKGQEPKFRTMLSLYSAVTGGNRNLDIAPNSISVGQNFHVMRKAGRVENFQPHMHLRGKAMMVEAILPNGTQQVLGFVNNFEFNWMNNYVFDDDYAPLLPKGTILKITAWHDNTAAKKSNPDPTQWIGWGDRTVDEMAHAWINITYMSDADFVVEQQRRASSR